MIGTAGFGFSSSAKTDGIPLFLEELTKMVIESDLLVDSGDAFTLDRPLPPLAIPSSIQDSLLARLDRLAPVKEVAQAGSVIGREFGFELLSAMSPLSEDELIHALDQLVNSVMVLVRGTPPTAIYTFKHALVQDTAYRSLLIAQRQRLHAQIAKALESSSRDIVENEPEILAHHYTSAGLEKEAIQYWEKAGQKAGSRSASVEAVKSFNRAITLLSSIDDGFERKRRELNLQQAVGTALVTANAEVGRDC